MLANVYLDRLDTFVEETLLPCYNRGVERQANPTYVQLSHRARYLRRRGRREEARVIRRQAQRLPSRRPDDPDYRRLRYLRYADDFLLGFAGPRAEADEIKRQLGEFLQHQLNLDLSDAKTLITHARSEAAHFLGYEVHVVQNDTKLDRRGHRHVNGAIGLRVPLEVIRAKCASYLRHGIPIHRSERLNDSLYSIVQQYQAEYRGAVEYYRLAYNLHRFDRLKWVMERSLAMTLAGKLKTSVAKVYARYQTSLTTDHGTYKVLQVTVEREGGKPPLVAHWGGISLAWNSKAVLNDRPQRVWNARTELLQRLLADTCELCGSQDRVQVHHVRHLKDLQTKGR